MRGSSPEKITKAQERRDELLNAVDKLNKCDDIYQQQVFIKLGEVVQSMGNGSES
jgi:hypothetical protein